MGHKSTVATRELSEVAWMASASSNLAASEVL